MALGEGRAEGQDQWTYSQSMAGDQREESPVGSLEPEQHPIAAPHLFACLRLVKKSASIAGLEMLQDPHHRGITGCSDPEPMPSGNGTSNASTGRR